MNRLRRWMLVLLVGMFCLIGSSCDALYRLLDKEGAEEKALIGEILPFELNVKVEEVQRLLKIYGYSVGEVDGALGSRTRDAIEQFQRDRGIKPSRFVDRQTWEALHVFVHNGLIVDGRVDVRLVQRILQVAGFDPGDVDGVLGPQTIRAIRAFQKAYGLTVDGKIGYETLSRLGEFL